MDDQCEGPDTTVPLRAHNARQTQASYPTVRVKAPGRPKVELTCSICGDNFLRWPSHIQTGPHFCKRKCKDRGMVKATQRDCNYCAKPISRPPSGFLASSGLFFCDPACRGAYKSKVHPKVELVCSWSGCGNKFLRWSWDVKESPPYYCSRACMGASSITLVELACAYCGDDFARPPNYLMKGDGKGPYYCSHKCLGESQRSKDFDPIGRKSGRGDAWKKAVKKTGG